MIEMGTDVIGEALHATMASNPAAGATRAILYGAGALGRWTACAMRQSGLTPLGFCDSNPKNHYTMVDGLMVWPEWAAKTREDDLVVVTIYNGGAVRRQLQERGLRVASFPQFYREHLHGKAPIPLPYGAIDDRENILSHEQHIRRAYDVWHDDQSREEYLAQLRWRMTLDDSGMPAPLPAEAMYFPTDLIPWQAQDCFVDVGAFDGDTLEQFRLRRGFQSACAIAIEADPTNAAKVREYIAKHRLDLAVRVHEAAAISFSGPVYFNANGTMGAGISAEGKAVVQAVRLDDLLANDKPTRIKMDIEGSELLALRGCAGTIRRCRPALAICLYHLAEHLWEIPIYLKSLIPEYRLYLRRYGEECWETVCYAVAG